jgi:hypothetical protein
MLTNDSGTPLPRASSGSSSPSPSPALGVPPPPGGVPSPPALGVPPPGPPRGEADLGLAPGVPGVPEPLPRGRLAAHAVWGGPCPQVG